MIDKDPDLKPPLEGQPALTLDELANLAISASTHEELLALAGQVTSATIHRQITVPIADAVRQLIKLQSTLAIQVVAHGGGMTDSEVTQVAAMLGKSADDVRTMSEDDITAALSAQFSTGGSA
jgi:hypothetical protein